MNTKTLFELATLDAWGLLDDQERQALDAAFAAAPAALQAQVRAHQARLSDLSAILPDVRPSASLRDRVLAAVGAEQALAGASSAVVRPASTLDHPGVIARIVPGPAGMPPMVRSRMVSPLWRAAAVGSAVAAIVFGFATVQMHLGYAELEKAIANDRVAELFAKEFGPKFENALLDERTQFIQFASQVQAARDPAAAPLDRAIDSGMAVILLDRRTGAAQFFSKDLPDGERLQLTILDARGNPGDVLLSFRATGSREIQTIEKLDLAPGESLVINAASQPGRPLLKSNNI